MVETADYVQQACITAEDCRAQLGRILVSSEFEASSREQRFLSYIVEEALAGRSSRIKAYSIALEVFGRDASFDPQGDPMVRIQAGHLRRTLERYYFTTGQSDPILITIPKGGYVPVFSRRSPPAISPAAIPIVLEKPSTEAGAKRIPGPIIGLLAFCALLALLALFGNGDNFRPSTPEIPGLLVQPLGDVTGSEISASIASGLTQELVDQLSKFRDIKVFASTDGSGARPRFILSGSVELFGDSFRLRVRLTNYGSSSVLWAKSYDGETKVANLLATEADIARNVAISLAQTYGVIFQADSQVEKENAPDDWDAYSCTLSYYAYRANLDPQARPAVRTCLETAVERFPTYATAWGLLSQVYIDEVRFTYPFDPEASSVYVDRALAAARLAVQIDPLNIRGLQAEMFALYFSKEIQAALVVGKHAMEINPNDTELMGEYGFRLALSGNWDQGCPLIEEARSRNPGPLAYYEAALALCSYFEGNYTQAVMWINKTTAVSNVTWHLIAAAIFAEAGLPAEATRERRWLNANAPAAAKSARQEFALRLARVTDVDLFVRSLRKAGLTVD